ncbi:MULTISPECIES: XRE family transcriptional regulator [Actinosynnema]|uniref:ImmA/IrrE family metallo-endopeptidase n=1 Tax=Actinosynnema TaxID=40566 RepID=UPI0020A4B81C|nr:XRE family transcriptional regulator [Actinosynnema pretiosum]MCP2097946.1 Zn-dependent peptidase ImmA, M78 family [Actinosynnema pretiosum]
MPELVPTRLTQARHLAGLTRRGLADRVGVTPTAVGQYEQGAHRPRPELLAALAAALDVPPRFLTGARPHTRLDPASAHFRSLRATRSYQRAKAVAHTEQTWELASALERRAPLPAVDLPALPGDPVTSARALRAAWRLGTGPIRDLVRRMEERGVLVQCPPRDADLETVDAFSTAALPRPVVVLTPNRADDVHRHRFSAAHELGHLVLHGDRAPGGAAGEREADVFAAEFLAPADRIRPELPRRGDPRALAELRRTWGVSATCLLRRCHELGLLSDSAAGRAHLRLRTCPEFEPSPLAGHPGEQPSALRRAFEAGCGPGGPARAVAALAAELAWRPARVRELLALP